MSDVYEVASLKVDSVRYQFNFPSHHHVQCSVVLRFIPFTFERSDGFLL